MKPGPKPLPEIVRFWRHVEIDLALGACWLWTGLFFFPQYATKYGAYGQFKTADRRRIHAHRWIYQHLYGPLRPDMRVLHRCDVRQCVRPSHLFAGTSRDNTRDMIAKGRWYSPFVHR
jgi:hypothetical protein